MTAAERWLWWTKAAAVYRQKGRPEWAATCEAKAEEIACAWFFEEAA